jgi:poly(A) polymerase
MCRPRSWRSRGASAGDIKDIWALQPRFEQRSGKRPYGVLQQPRFKAGYDFLLLRVESGEVEREVGDWWTEFLDASDERRAAMLLPQAAAAPRRRRRRRAASEPSAASQAE